MTTGQLKGIKRAKYQNIIYIKCLSHNKHVRMIPRAMLAVAYATGGASHARQFKGDNPDKKGYPGLPGWRTVTGRNSQARQSYPREYRPCQSELQVFLAQEVVLGKGPVPRVAEGLDKSPKL